LAWLLMAAEQNEVTAIKALKDVEPLKPTELENAKQKKEMLAKLVKK